MTPNSHEPPPLEKTRREIIRDSFPTFIKIGKVLLVVIPSLLLLLVIACLLWNRHSSGKLKDARAAAAKAGLPLSIEAFDAKRGTLEDAQNAAHYYEAAFSLLRAEGADAASRVLHAVVLPARQLDSLPEEYVGDMRAVVESQKQVIDILHRASAVEECIYEIDTGRSYWNIPRRWSANSCAFLLQLAVRLAAEERRGADGIRMTRDAVALARSFDQEPFTASMYFRLELTQAALSEDLSRLLSRSAVAPEDILALQKDIERFAEECSPRAAIEGQCAYVVDILDSFIRGESSIGWLITPRRKIETGSEERFVDVIPRWISQGYFKADEALLIRYSLNILKDIDKPQPSRPAAMNPLIMQRIDRYHYLSSSFHINARYAVLVAWPQHKARLGVTAAALAALRFEMDHGRWPATLEELVPAYLEKHPVDPCARVPVNLVYTVLKEGIVVHSVGENGVDENSGVGRRPSLDLRGLAWDDIGFVIRRTPGSGS